MVWQVKNLGCGETWTITIGGRVFTIKCRKDIYKVIRISDKLDKLKRNSKGGTHALSIKRHSDR